MSVENTSMEAGDRTRSYRGQERSERGCSPERAMVCMSSNPEAPRLLRHGERMAARLGARLYAVYVETARERPNRITVRDSEALATNLAIAQDLGATVVHVRATRTADGLIQFARREGITHVILGQTQRSPWEILLRGSVLDRFLREVPDVAVQIVAQEAEAH